MISSAVKPRISQFKYDSGKLLGILSKISVRCECDKCRSSLIKFDLTGLLYTHSELSGVAAETDSHFHEKCSKISVSQMLSVVCFARV